MLNERKLSSVDRFSTSANGISSSPNHAGTYVYKGLDGVIADTTAISHVIPEMKALSYRGYPVHELANCCSYEEVAYLILYGDLPTAQQLEDFENRERSLRKISSRVLRSIENMPKNAHPMDRLISSITYLSLEDYHSFENNPVMNMERSIRLIAAIPTLIAADYRIRLGEEPIPPDGNLGLAANFLSMYFGKLPSKSLSKSFEASLILYAEHTFNASTFTARVIASTLSDIYSAVIGGVCAIKGHLHGGANEDVMRMLIDIDSPEKALSWLRLKLRRKEKIPGFGHRVYKRGDSRYPIMKRYLATLSDWSGNNRWYEICEILESYMIQKKGIHPNLDFASGPAYYLMGLDIDLFTPLFVMSRTVGWTANIMEQYAHNKLIRPLSLYSGSPIRKFVQIDAR